MHLVIFGLLAMLADSDSDAAGTAFGIFAGLWAIWAIVCLGLIILGIVINWRIAEQAGFQGIASLLMLIPLVNLVVMLYFAFSEWPVTRALREARAAGGGASLQPRM